MNNKKIAQTTIVVTIILIFSKISGFLRDVALAYAYGTSIESDAFVLALSVIGIFSILFTATALAFMPTYKAFLEKEDFSGRKFFLDATYTIMGIVSCIIAIIGASIVGMIVEILAPGFTAEAHKIASDITRILIVTIPTTFLMTMGGQHLRGENSFLAPAAIAIPLNIILLIAFVGITPIFGIQGVAWAYVLGTLIQVVWMYSLLRKKDYKFKPNFEYKNRGLHKIMVLTLPILLGNAIQTINTIVDRMLASGLEAGSMAALNFSNKLALFVIGLISLGAGNVCYTKMSEFGATKNIDGLKMFLRNIINILNTIVIPATVGMIVLSTPIIKTVFEYGAFDASSRSMTVTALIFYSIGLVGYSLRDMITRAFYSIQDSKTPMINGILAVIINVVGNLVLVQVMGLGGLALATSISAIVGTLLLLYSLRKKIGCLGGKEMLLVFFKSSIAAGIMGIVVHFGYIVFYDFIGIVPIALILDICVGMAVYGIIILFMNIKEVEFVKGYLIKKIKKIT